jgi:hypothetical protein
VGSVSLAVTADPRLGMEKPRESPMTIVAGASPRRVDAAFHFAGERSR